MQSIDRSRQPLGRREEGIALIVTLMVLMLVSVLMVGFVASIIADTRASGLDRDQTQAYAATHAGLEQITSDLSNLFVTDFSPTTSQITLLTVTPPNLPGFTFIAPGGAAGSGYSVVPRFLDVTGNPRPEDPVNGSPITAGPYQGFRGIITPYDITVTARSRGGAEVRMRRTLQTVAIPVFQFGMFSETDLAFHAGAEAFSFGGRVHTNGNLFLAAADGGTLTIADRITAFKDIIRTHLPNGLATTSGYGGLVRIPTTIAANPAANVYRNLLRTEGSITGTIPPVQVPIAPDYAGWVGLSQGTYLNEEARPSDRCRSRRQRAAGRGGDRAHSAPCARLGREHRHAIAAERLHATILRAGERTYPAVGHGRGDHQSADSRRSPGAGGAQWRGPTVYRLFAPRGNVDERPVTARHLRPAGIGPGDAARQRVQRQSRHVHSRWVHQDRNPAAARGRAGADRRRVAGRDRRGARSRRLGTKHRGCQRGDRHSLEQHS
jgi:hypothetical protein